MIFMRHPPPGVAPIHSPELLLEGLEAQCGQHIRHDPGQPCCARGLSELYAFQGKPDKALQWIAYYLERRTGPDPEAERTYQSLRVTSLSNTALSLENNGDLAGAEPLFRTALQIAERELGPDHPATAGALNNLAGLLESKGDYAGAEASYRRALGIAEKTLGPADPRTAMALDNLAGLLHAKGDPAGAEPLYRRALSIAERSLGPDHPTTRTIREELKALLEEAHFPIRK